MTHRRYRPPCPRRPAPRSTRGSVAGRALSLALALLILGWAPYLMAEIVSLIVGVR